MTEILQEARAAAAAKWEAAAAEYDARDMPDTAARARENAAAALAMVDEFALLPEAEYDPEPINLTA